MDAILDLRDLTVRYGQAAAVRGVSLRVAPGEIVGVVGESGSGKSSVLRAVAGLLGRGGTAGGQALFRGPDGCVDLCALTASEHGRLRGREIAYVFQDPVSSLDPLMRVGAQFDECLAYHRIATGKEAHRLTCDLLAQMGLPDVGRVLDSFPHQLSGGMCQRVVLALSMALRPRLLLADEPTSALDATTGRQVIDLMGNLQSAYGFSALVVSHDIAAVSRVASRIAVMRRGALVEQGPTAQVLAHPSHPYTRALIEAVPKLTRSGKG